jgi:caffeoyl-CoA O-methyltransferase
MMSAGVSEKRFAQHFISCSMEFIDEKLAKYSEDHTSGENDLLKELNRETWAKVMMPRMLSGHLQGRFLSMLSKMIRPHEVLEIGTYTGYSALCLAEGLADGGVLHTIDINEELSDMVGLYIKKAGLQGTIRCYTGSALDIIPTLPAHFDLVFIDADKENYSAYYQLVFERIRPGGYIIADNVLWSGKITDEKQLAKDKDTRALHEFNRMVQSDPRVENVLLPVRDGLMLIRKR